MPPLAVHHYDNLVPGPLPTLYRLDETWPQMKGIILVGDSGVWLHSFTYAVCKQVFGTAGLERSGYAFSYHVMPVERCVVMSFDAEGVCTPRSDISLMRFGESLFDESFMEGLPWEMIAFRAGAERDTGFGVDAFFRSGVI